MKYRLFLLVLLGLSLGLSGCIVFSVSLMPKPAPYKEEVLEGKGKFKFLLVDISGMITEENPGPFSIEPDLVSRMKEQLNKAAEDEEVKGLLLRINSPGGTVTASDIIHHEVMAYKKKTGNPVYAVIMGLGTSGGYYVAVSADRIVAHPTTVTGSIGVLMLNVNVHGLLEKIGVENTTIKSGDKKDMGSPLKPMTQEEKALFKGVIDELYQGFIDVVAEGREGLTREEIRKLADGRIYTARQALEAGLVDRIGYLKEVFESAKAEAGLDEAQLIIYRRPGTYRKTIYSQSPTREPLPERLSQFNFKSLLQPGVPKFMYLWMPSSH